MIPYCHLLHTAVRKYGFSVPQVRALVELHPGKDAGIGLSADYSLLYDKIISGEIKPH